MRRLNVLRAAMATLGWMIGITAASSAPPLEIYGKLPGFEMAAISPSGNRIAIIGVVGDTRRLIVTENGNAIYASDVGDAKLRSLDWASDDQILLRVGKTVPLGIDFTADHTEVSSMLVISVTDKVPWHVFGKSGKVTGGIRGHYATFERDGVNYGYFGGMTLDSRGYFVSGEPDLYEVNLNTQKARIIARRTTDQEDYRDWVVGRDGTVAATLDYFSLRGEWRIRNAEQRVIASGMMRTGQVDLVGLGRTPDTILYAVGDEEHGTRFLEQPLDGRPPIEVIDAGVMGYLKDRRTGLLIGYVRNMDMPEDVLFDPLAAKKMVATRKAFPGLTVRLIDQDAKFERLIVQTSGPGDPNSWWIVDTKKKTADILGLGYAMLEKDVGPMRMVRYRATDGLEMAGVLTLPPGRDAKNLPVIIMPHGGPEARDYPVFDWMAQAFASRGYAVFQPNFRGSSGSGSAFVRAGWGEWGRKMQTDMSDGLAELARQGIVDPKRACIVGASYGGYAALAGVTVQQGLYRCAVSIAGIGDVRKMISNDLAESGNNPTLIRVLKKELGRGRDLAQVSPIRFADRADAPVMLIHGVDDIVVPYRQSSEMAAALANAGKPVELVKLPGEDHWLSRSETRLTMLKAAVGFVEKHNPSDMAK